MPVKPFGAYYAVTNAISTIYPTSHGLDDTHAQLGDKLGMRFFRTKYHDLFDLVIVDDAYRECLK